MNDYIAPRSKLFGHIDRVLAVLEGWRPPPVNVEIDLSNRCSLGCKWCHFGYTHTKGPLAGDREKPGESVAGGDLMDTDLALSIIDQLSRIGVRSITWSGGGEPTLHPDFDTIIGHAYKQGIDQGLYTLGGHIDRDRAELLKQSMTWVYVSLDAHNEQYYSSNKGVLKKRFADACDGVMMLSNAAGYATIGLGYIVTRNNWPYVGEFVRLAKGLGADYTQFRPAIMYKANDPGVVDESGLWVEKAISELMQFQGDDFVIADLKRFEMYKNWTGHGYDTCWWSGLQTVITPNGKVWTCCNKREYPGASIGDLSRESFFAVWNRGNVAEVDEKCRVFCRGHLPNLAIEEMAVERKHGNFI